MKKIILTIFAIVFCLIFIAGCTSTSISATSGMYNRTEGNSTNSPNTPKPSIKNLNYFQSEVKKIVPSMKKTTAFFQMAGAKDGFKIFDTPRKIYRIEIYKFDKNSAIYIKSEKNQQLYWDGYGLSVKATVKNGYALIIDANFPHCEQIISLFNELT